MQNSGDNIRTVSKTGFIKLSLLEGDVSFLMLDGEADSAEVGPLSVSWALSKCLISMSELSNEP